MSSSSDDNSAHIMSEAGISDTMLSDADAVEVEIDIVGGVLANTDAVEVLGSPN